MAVSWSHGPHIDAEMKHSWLVDIRKLEAYTGGRFVQYLLRFIRSIHSYIVREQQILVVVDAGEEVGVVPGEPQPRPSVGLRADGGTELGRPEVEEALLGGAPTDVLLHRLQHPPVHLRRGRHRSVRLLQIQLERRPPTGMGNSGGTVAADPGVGVSDRLSGVRPSDQACAAGIEITNGAGVFFFSLRRLL